MTLSPVPFLKQVAALSLLILIIGTTFWLAERTVVEPLRSRGAHLTMLSKQLIEMRSSQKSQKVLARRQVAAEQELLSLNIFWQGPNRPQIAAAMQDLLRMAVKRSDGHIITTSVLEDLSKGRMVSVRARIDGTLTTLQSTLSAIEQSRPRLFVNSLVVTTASAESTLVQAQLLSFEIGLAGYVAADDPATL